MGFGADALLAGILATFSWVGYLAKNYFAEMSAIKLEEARNNQENEQRRIEKQEKYFELLLQNILTVVGEEKDRALELQERIIRTNQEVVTRLERLAELHEQTHRDLKNCVLPTIQWDGSERRHTQL